MSEGWDDNEGPKDSSVDNLDTSPEALALAEGERGLMSKWGDDSRFRSVVDSLRDEQGRLGDKSRLYALVAMAGVAGAVFGLPAEMHEHIAAMTSPGGVGFADVSTRIVGAGTAVMAAFESWDHLKMYLRKGREINGDGAATAPLEATV